MSKTILAEVDGFTPVIDSVVKDTSPITALVFGRMWRFCQFSDGVCRASLEKIADGIGIDRATVFRHAVILVEKGYLEDKTPDLRNKPHIYSDTGKAGLTLQLKTTVADNNSSVAQRNVTVAESHMKIVLKKEKDNSVSEKPSETTIPGNPIIKTFDPDEVEKPPKKIKIKKSADPRIFPFAQEIATLCSLGMGNGSDGELFRAAKLLVNCSGAPNKPHDLRQFFAKGGKIYHEWPWNKGERLKPMDIVKHWPRLSGSIKPPEVKLPTQRPYEEA